MHTYCYVNGNNVILFNTRLKNTLTNTLNKFQVNQQQQACEKKGIDKYVNAQTTLCRQTTV